MWNLTKNDTKELIHKRETGNDFETKLSQKITVEGRDKFRGWD